MNYHAIARGIQSVLMALIGVICWGFFNLPLCALLAFGISFLYLWLALERNQ